jgi:quinolinate synthetase A subunit
MAETAKLMNPNKKVLLPDMGAGCSLASSISGKDVRMLKEKYPGVPVVTYVNTSAEVKAESDICCTSANAIKVVESLGTDKVIFLPDQYMAKYVQTKTKVQIISWVGTCIVHEKFSAQEIKDIKNSCFIVISLPIFSLQKGSGCSRQCLLDSVLPSNISLSQLNIELTASFKLFAKLSLL